MSTVGIISDNFETRQYNIGGILTNVTTETVNQLLPYNDYDSFLDFIQKYCWSRIPKKVGNATSPIGVSSFTIQGKPGFQGEYFYKRGNNSTFDNYYIIPVYGGNPSYYSNQSLTSRLNGAVQTTSNTEAPDSQQEYYYNSSPLGNFIDLDYTKLVLYPQIQELDLDTMIVSLIDYKTYKTNGKNHIPLHLILNWYYGNEGARQSATSINFLYMSVDNTQTEWNASYTSLGDTFVGNEFNYGYTSTGGYNKAIPGAVPMVALKPQYLPSEISSGYFSANMISQTKIFGNAPYPFSGSDVQSVNDGWQLLNTQSGTLAQWQSMNETFQYRLRSNFANVDLWNETRPIAFLSTSSIENIFNSFGTYWAETLSAVQSKTGIDADDNDLHLPTIDENGVTGGGVTGKGIRQVPYGNERDMSNKTPSKYIDQKKIDKNKYTDRVPLTVPSLSPIGVFNTVYGISYNDVNSFVDWIWNTDDTTFIQITNNLKMFNNPIEAIISLRLYPFDVTRVKYGVGENKEIILGRVGSGINGVELLPDWYALIDMGHCTYYEQFKDFMDYDYVNASLYLPYVGIVNIEPTMFMGKTIDVRYVVDIMTGKCTAIVYANSLPILYQDGTIGVDVPITAQDKYNYFAKMENNKMEQRKNSFNTVMGAMGSVSSMGTSIYNGNYGNALTSGMGLINAIGGGILNQKQLEKQAQMTTVDIVKLSSSTPNSSNWQPQKPYFILQRPIPEYPNNYGRVYGYVYNKTEKLSNLSGFTVIDNPQLENINAPTDIVSRIGDLMSKGIII